VPERVAQQITVAVRLFASYREQAGRARLDAEVPEGARVRDLQAQLTAQIPALAATRGLVAVNQTYVGPDLELHHGDEVAFIPPVSGGADQSCPAQQPLQNLFAGG
jgi:MoaE-MoaD fusion protein